MQTFRLGKLIAQLAVVASTGYIEIVCCPPHLFIGTRRGCGRSHCFTAGKIKAPTLAFACSESSGVKPRRRKPRHVQIRARMTELGITRLRARSRTRTSRTRTGGCKRSFHSKGGTYGGGVMLLSADRPRMDLTPTRRRLTSHVRRNQTLSLDDGCGRSASRQQGRGKWIQQVPPHDRTCRAGLCTLLRTVYFYCIYYSDISETEGSKVQVISRKDKKMKRGQVVWFVPNLYLPYNEALF